MSFIKFKLIKLNLEMSSFIVLYISCSSPYKKCVNSSLNLWDHMWISHIQRWICKRDMQKNDTKHISKFNSPIREMLIWFWRLSRVHLCWVSMLHSPLIKMKKKHTHTHYIWWSMPTQQKCMQNESQNVKNYFFIIHND
jgi:hypothetical protein